VFSLTLIGIADLSSLAAFITESVHCQIIHEQHLQVEFGWLRRLILSPSEIIRQGRARLGTAVEMFVQLLATSEPATQFDRITGSCVI
jgi:hypothetical protein